MIRVPQLVTGGKQVLYNYAYAPRLIHKYRNVPPGIGFSVWPSENWSPHRTVSAALTVLSMSTISINPGRTHGQRFFYFLTL